MKNEKSLGVMYANKEANNAERGDTCDCKINDSPKECKPSEPHPCDTCIHKPICSYCSKHLPNFTLPTANDSCDLYESEELDAVDLEEVCEVRKFTSPFVDTIEGMLSPDYKERFRAEYIQTKIRYERLKAFNTKIEAAFRTECERPEVKKAPMPPHDCPHDLLREQQEVMGHYLHILEVRAVIEGVDLGGC
jgi:hypothetical protein